MAAARKVEPRFDDNSVNNSLVVANIGESVALHCRIWMKQVTAGHCRVPTLTQSELGWWLGLVPAV